LVPNELEDISEFQVALNPRLPEDSDGYYHLTINRNNWQTIHRIDGNVVDENNYPFEFVRFEWESDLFWYLGDTGSISVSNYTGLGFVIFSKLI
tara:strand:- start:147 stop:428 length:282 start_codon:yes stop_codon:yes gene_type:complete